MPRPVAALWRLRVSDGWAHAEIWNHPIGWELRVFWDGELQRSQAYRDVGDAHADAEETPELLEGYNRECLSLGLPERPQSHTYLNCPESDTNPGKKPHRAIQRE